MENNEEFPVRKFQNKKINVINNITGKKITAEYYNLTTDFEGNNPMHNIILDRNYTTVFGIELKSGDHMHFNLSDYTIELI